MFLDCIVRKYRVKNTLLVWCFVCYVSTKNSGVLRRNI